MGLPSTEIDNRFGKLSKYSSTYRCCQESSRLPPLLNTTLFLPAHHQNCVIDLYSHFPPQVFVDSQQLDALRTFSGAGEVENFRGSGMRMLDGRKAKLLVHLENTTLRALKHKRPRLVDGYMLSPEP